VIIFDTGPLVAAADVDNRHHARCVDLIARTPRPLLVPAPVMVEVCWLLEREKGSRAESAFLRSIRSGSVALVSLTDTDIDRMIDLVDIYDDLPLGAVDASVIAVAERLRATEIATLDRRDFTIVRPQHVAAFTLLPD